MVGSLGSIAVGRGGRGVARRRKIGRCVRGRDDDRAWSVVVGTAVTCKDAGVLEACAIVVAEGELPCGGHRSAAEGGKDRRGVLVLAISGAKAGLMWGAEGASPAVVGHTCCGFGARGSGFAVGVSGCRLSLFFGASVVCAATEGDRMRVWDIGDGLVFTEDRDTDRADVVERTAHPCGIRRRYRGETESCHAVLTGAKARDIDISIRVQHVPAMDIGACGLPVDHIASVHSSHDFDALVGEVADQDRVGLSASSKHEYLAVMPEVREGASVTAQLHAYRSKGDFASAACDPCGGTAKLRPKKQGACEQKET